MIMVLLAGSIVLEFGLLAPLLWGLRRYAAIAIIISTGLAAGMLVTWQPNPFTALIAFICIYRVINILRIVEARMHEKYLRESVKKTSVMLTLYTLVVLLGWWLWGALGLQAIQISNVLVIIQLICAGLLLLATVRAIGNTKPPKLSRSLTDRDLPSITVAIPARNETEDLAACLQSIVASDYPKLEVLVLDDCSQDKTSEIIRSFAQDGVRFIQGEQPKDTWLAKNQAYAKLAKEASGEFLLFCGVDVRFDSQTIRELVAIALLTNKRMVSLLPKRYEGGVGISIIQPVRYWWELALPRKLFNRPPVLSTCWLIERQAVSELGGFEAVSRTIIPEVYFARELARANAYSFIRSDENLHLHTVKKLNEQVNTAIRTRYPQLRKRPALVLLLTLIELCLLIGPFLLPIYAWIQGGSVSLLALISSFLLIATHSLVITVTNPSNWWLALINLPIVILADVVITHISMWKYEFSVVEWKGRNICIPVMHTTAHLPKLDAVNSKFK